MQKKQKRALQATILVALFAALPLVYFAYLTFTTPALEVRSLGVVPEFALSFSNNPVGMTHYDAERHPTVVAIVGDQCERGCGEMSQYLSTLASWVNESIRKDLPNVKDPSKIRLIAMGEGSQFESSMPPEWDLVNVNNGGEYLLPPAWSGNHSPAFVVIDDSGFYRAYLPLSEPRLLENLKVLITRITSHQYLMHYVAQQALMWEKSRGRMRQQKSTE